MAGIAVFSLLAGLSSDVWACMLAIGTYDVNMRLYSLFRLVLFGAGPEKGISWLFGYTKSLQMATIYKLK